MDSGQVHDCAVHASPAEVPDTNSWALWGNCGEDRCGTPHRKWDRISAFPSSTSAPPDPVIQLPLTFLHSDVTAMVLFSFCSLGSKLLDGLLPYFFKSIYYHSNKPPRGSWKMHVFKASSNGKTFSSLLFNICACASYNMHDIFAQWYACTIYELIHTLLVWISPFPPNR